MNKPFNNQIYQYHIYIYLHLMYILWCKSQLSCGGHRGSSGSQAARRAAGGGGQESGEGLVTFFPGFPGDFPDF
jgi:hypothetical protein